MSSGAMKRRCPLLLLAQLIFQVIVSAAQGLPAVQLQPADLRDLVEAEERDVRVQVALSQRDAASDADWLIAARSLHPGVASVKWDEADSGAGNGAGNQEDFPDSEGVQMLPLNTSAMAYDDASRYYTLNTTLTVRGEFLGKTGVKVRLVRADDWIKEGADAEKEYRVREEWIRREAGGEGERTMEVWVSRGGDSVRLTKIFVGCLMVLIPMANVLMGCEIDMAIVLATLRRPTAPLIGLAAQFLFMPLLAYVIAQSIFVPHGEYSLALGLFVTGCAPGGGASNFWTILLDGNVNLSVTMTFLSTLASLVMMPLWIYLLGTDFLVGFAQGSVIRVPYAKIGSSLGSLVGPLLIGVAIARFKPTWAAGARKVMRPFIIFILVFVILFGCLSNLYMFRMLSARAMIGGLLLPWCGFMFGCFASIITRRAPGDVTAIAIETGIQNTGVAILLLKFSFPAPDSDISSLLPVIVASFTPGPLLLGAAIHMTLKRLQKRKSEVCDAEKSLSSPPLSGGSGGGRVLPLVVLPSSPAPLFPSVAPLLPAPDLVVTPSHFPVVLQLPIEDRPTTQLVVEA